MSIQKQILDSFSFQDFKIASKEISMLTIAQQLADYDNRLTQCCTPSLLRLRPNGFWKRPGRSDWDSGGANFAKGLRPLALIPSSRHAAGVCSRALTTHSANVLAYRGCFQKPLHPPLTLWVIAPAKRRCAGE